MAIKSLMPDKRTWTPGSLLGFRSAFDRLFDEWAGGKETNLFAPLETGNGGYLPMIDLTETDEAYQVTAELPGMVEKDVEVELNSEYLTIRGEKREEKEEKRKGLRRSERTFGAFRRDITLPGEVQPEKATAHFDAGVLTIELPKSPEAEARTRKIPIHGS